MLKHFLEKFQELETFGAFALTPSFHPLLTHDFQPEKNLLRSIVWRNCCLRRGSRERGEEKVSHPFPFFLLAPQSYL